MKLNFRRFLPAKPLKFWVAKPMQQSITLYILDDERFDRLAKLYGHSTKAGGFAVWGKVRPRIYLRHTRLDLFGHEVRHIQDGHFH